MEIFLTVIFCIATIIILVYLQLKQAHKLKELSIRNDRFLESIEKYIEIFNEQNVDDLVKNKKHTENSIAEEKVKTIREEYRKKLIAKNNTLSEEHEMLIDFVTLALSLLIKTPPTLRQNIIDDNTDNELIKKILNSQLPSIEDYYIPVSLLEVAISKKDL